MKSRIKQITTEQMHGKEHVIYALCDDGTLWQKIVEFAHHSNGITYVPSMSEHKWVQISTEK
jgi:hypothetical protein